MLPPGIASCYTGGVEAIRKTIHDYFDKGYTLVFPKEKSSAFWLADYALHHPNGAIRSDRAMSWDTFSSQFSPHHADERPMTPMIRQLFASQLLPALKKEGDGLQYFVSQEYPETLPRFAMSVASILPQLGQVKEQVLSQVPAAMAHDLVVLKQRYEAFLKDRKFFDPAFESVGIEYAQPQFLDKKPFVILWPDVNPRSSQFLQSIGNPTWIETWSLGNELPVPSLEVFDNQLQEIRTQLRRIEYLLQQGVCTHDILITCCDLQSCSDIIVGECQNRGIPLRVASGKSPLSYAAGRFFSAIKAVYDEQVSLASMKRLLLDPTFPWKDPQQLRELVSTAVDLRIERGSFTGSDQWAVRLGKRNAELAQLYHDLKETVRNICTSTNGTLLRAQIRQFQDRFFTDAQWNTTEADDPARQLSADVYSFCLQQVEELDSSLKTAGFSTYEGLYSMFLRTLERSRYVPQAQRGGIELVAYPMTAGMEVRHHFMINMHHDVTQLVDTYTSFLPETLEDASLQDEDDYTIPMLRLCGATLGSGGHMSCSRHTYDGVVLPPSWFVEQLRTTSYDRSIPQVPDMFAQELVLWGADPQSVDGPCTHGLQVRWFEDSSLTHYGRNDADDMASRRVLTVGDLHGVFDAQSQRLLLPISPTSLDSFSSCPFKWAMQYLMGLQEETYDVPVVDHRQIGTLMHSVYEQFFKYVTQVSGPYHESMIPEYTAKLQTIWDEQLQKLCRSADGPTPVLAQWINHTFRDQVMQIITAELTNFEGARSSGFEQELSATLEAIGVTIKGRIDRFILLHPQGDALKPATDIPPLQNGCAYAVVDYKKGSVDGKEQYLNALAEHVAPPSFQLPMYARLLKEQCNAIMAIGCYFSIKDGEYSLIWSQADDPVAVELDAALETALVEMKHAVSQQDFRATPSKEACESCSFRQVCRRRYAVR